LDGCVRDFADRLDRRLRCVPRRGRLDTLAASICCHIPHLAFRHGEAGSIAGFLPIEKLREFGGRLCSVSGTGTCRGPSPIAKYVGQCKQETLSRRNADVLWTIFVILLVLWLLGMVSSYTLGGYIHILLVVAIVVVLIRVIQGRNPV